MPLHTAIVVQARMGSSRLPGKVMMDLGERTVLAEVLERCKTIPGAQTVVCAVPAEAASAPIAAVAHAVGAIVVEGSETDVLQRYATAARAVEADVIMRVTSDCPLIDPYVCGQVLELRNRTSADYAANNLVRSFPHGLDCEAFTAQALYRAEISARDAYAREHVTPWLRQVPDLRRANLACAEPGRAAERWTLDYPEDLDFVRAVVPHLPTGRTRMAMASVFEVLAAHPSFRQINACRREAAPTPAKGNQHV